MTETEVERLLVRLVGESGQYVQTFNQAQNVASSATSAINSSVGTMAAGIKGGFLSSVGSVVAFAGNFANAAMGVVNLTKGIIQAASGGFGLVMQAENAQSAFKTMLGDGAAAEKMMKDIRSFAASTPLQTNDLVQAAKTLMQFGVEGKNTLPIMKMLGDVTGGDSQRFSQMSLAFGQMAASGRLMGQDLLQMINAGFNPLKEMSRTTGKSMEELKKQMEAGGISANMVVKAFQSATSAGGQFNGMMNEQSKTLSGTWSTFSDNVSIITQQIFTKIVDGLNLKGILTYVSSFLDTFSQNFEENFTALTTWVAGVWSYWVDPFVETFMQMGAAVSSWVEFAVTSIGAFVGNTIGFFANFNENVLALWNWLGSNWQNLLKDMLNMLGVFGSNMVSNVGVYINMQFRLWTAFGGWLVGMFERIFSFEVVDAVLSGLIIVGEKIRDWANAAWETLKGVFTGKTAPGALDKFFEQVNQDMVKGADNMNFVQTAADIIKEESSNMKNPLEGFQSSLSELPDLNLKTNGVPLPQFVWKTGQDAKNAFNGSITGMADPILKEANKMKGIEAVAAGSAEALSRIAEFQAGKVIGTAATMAVAVQQKKESEKKGVSGLGYMSPEALSKLSSEKNVEQNSAVLDAISNGIQTLVNIGQQQLGQPTIQLQAGGGLA